MCTGADELKRGSTGQACKGGPNSGVFLQVTCDDPADIDVFGHSYGFGMVERGRRAPRVHLRDVDAGLPSWLAQWMQRSSNGTFVTVKQMQIGVIGLGRMGGNISRRLMKAGHIVVFDTNVKPREALAKEGAAAAGSLAEAVKALGEKPRAVWVMLPAGRITEETIERLGGLLEPDDIIIDGGNSFYKDDIRRAKKLAEKRIRYVDCGTSGGVWGIERGYCMMIGGPKEAVDRLDPIFSALAPGLGDIPRTPGHEKADPRAERGYIHAGPSGAGHFVKMVHNGIEYGLMQAYAEGFDIMRNKDFEGSARGRALRAEPAGYRGGVAARQRHFILAARSRRRRAGEGSAAEGFLRLRPGFRRGSLDRRGRDRGSGSGGRAFHRALCEVPLAGGAHLWRKVALGHALRLRRAHRG